MTVSTNDTVERFTVSGVGPYAFNFRIFAKSDLTISVISGTSITVLTLDTQYTIPDASVNSLTGGTVSLTAGPTGTAAVYAGYTLDIRSNIPNEQDTNILNSPRFLPAVIEATFDHLSREIQDLRRRVNASFRYPDNGILDGAMDPIAPWISKYVVVGPTGVLEPADLTSSGALTQSIIGALLYPRTAAELSAGVTPVAYQYPPLNVLRYGTNTTPGTTDMTTVIQNAVLVAEAGVNDTVIVPPGKYYIAGTITIRQGVAIICSGSQGSNENYGTVFVHGGSGTDCFVWNGNGIAFTGTGGGLRNCLIVKKAGVVGGRAINITATSDNFRPGEMFFQNILIYGLDATALWSKAIFVDGTACNTPGAKGVRTIHWNKIRVADCSTNNQYVHFKQVTHCYGDIQMDTGNGTGTLGMTIDDDWDHIDMDLRVGNVIVNYTGAANPDLNLRGSVDSLDVNTTAVIGTAQLKATTGITNQATLFRISSWLVDDFTAFVSSTVGNATGDGTSYAILFDTESYDSNASYDGGTGIYTVKVAGICDIDYGTVLTSLGAAHTTGELTLDHRDSGASSRNQISTKFGVGPARDAANQCGINNHIKLKVFEGDTLKVLIAVSGSTKTVGVGGAATRYSYFSCKTLA